MSKMSNYYIDQMEKKFGSVHADQNAGCYICGKELWKHKGCECPTDNSMDERSNFCRA